MRVAVIWRGSSDVEPAATRNYERLRPIFDALAQQGIDAAPVLYTDAGTDLRERLLRCDGALVWVDPISEGRTRQALNEILRDVVAHGGWVSAHPGTIDKMGTKEVLYRTRALGWGTDTRLYESMDSFDANFPASLADAGPRVLKQNRGNAGIGVWKVEHIGDDGVRVQHAAPRDDATELLSLADFMRRCGEYFADGGKVVDQPYMSRIAEGMIRAYMVERRVVGFARQRPDVAVGRVLGLPSAKTMYSAAATEFASLRASLEDKRIPGLCVAVGVDDDPAARAVGRRLPLRSED
jgi:hypothetical protein